jgi:hypothetical protein
MDSFNKRDLICAPDVFKSVKMAFPNRRIHPDKNAKPGWFYWFSTRQRVRMMKVGEREIWGAGYSTNKSKTSIARKIKQPLVKKSVMG